MRRLGDELFAALPPQNWWAFIPKVSLVIPRVFAELDAPSADYHKVDSYRVGSKMCGAIERDTILGLA